MILCIFFFYFFFVFLIDSLVTMLHFVILVHQIITFHVSTASASQCSLQRFRSFRSKVYDVETDLIIRHMRAVCVCGWWCWVWECLYVCFSRCVVNKFKSSRSEWPRRELSLTDCPILLTWFNYLHVWRHTCLESRCSPGTLELQNIEFHVYFISFIHLWHWNV